MSLGADAALDLPLRALAARLARREWSAEALAAACAARVAAHEPTLRAWAAFDAAALTAAARALDAGPVRGALHGVPVGVKDLIDTADWPTAYGSPLYAGHRPAVDAACVGQLRAAGALIAGKTVTTEFAAMHPGPTRNPRAPAGRTHTPGGSSSGSAAAVAAGLVPLALGTQTAASVVRPAAFCGVVGYKPTYGLLPVTGVKLQSPSLDTVGVFTRAVDDAAFAVGAMSGLDLTPQRPARLRVGLCQTPWWPSADEHARRAWARAGERLAARGAAVSAVDLPADWAALAEAQRDLMTYEAAAAFAPERRSGVERISAAFRAVLDAGAAMPLARIAAAHARLDAARAALPGLMRDVDVLVAPSAPGAAPEGLAGTGDPLFSRLWSALGVPCVQVPVDATDDGLPLGVTVVAPRWHDALALGAAQWLEGAAGA